MGKFRRFFLGSDSVSVWTVLGGIAGLLSFVLAAGIAFKGTSAVQSETRANSDKPVVSYSPVPSASLSISPSPVFVSPIPSDPSLAPTETGDGSTGTNTNPAKRFLVDTPFSSGSAESDNPVSFNNKLYGKTVTIFCGNNTVTKAWLVYGYSTFSAMLGISDSANNAIGTKINASFLNQDNQALGAPVESISLGSPKPISFPLKGAVQMQISCQARGGRYASLSLGNAELVR